MEYTYKTQNTCSTEIKFDIDENGVIRDVIFIGGCNGNLKAVAKLVEGCSVDEIDEKLSGITCGRRPTSCADQLAKAVKKAYNSIQR
ncbi:MAG: TIGR03905 family TSCPD domain-containing protein [Ruminococcaceae bacterium]|nr:TIGR03905 family TSCPD domain-containing protein [Oscillospiraceae bacterium]